MPSHSDHDRRDAWAAMRADIRLAVGRYTRRMEEAAKGHIQEKLEEAVQNGEAIDGTALGRVAAAEAVRTYIGAGAPTPAIDAPATEAPPASD
jgi:hypothetical protein